MEARARADTFAGRSLSNDRQGETLEFVTLATKGLRADQARAGPAGAGHHCAPQQRHRRYWSRGDPRGGCFDERISAHKRGDENAEFAPTFANRTSADTDPRPDLGADVDSTGNSDKFRADGGTRSASDHRARCIAGTSADPNIDGNPPAHDEPRFRCGRNTPCTSSAVGAPRAHSSGDGVEQSAGGLRCSYLVYFGACDR